MHKDVEVVLEDTSIGEAVIMLAEAHIHGVPVVDRQRNIVGSLSASDVLQATAEALFLFGELE